MEKCLGRDQRAAAGDARQEEGSFRDARRDQSPGLRHPTTEEEARRGALMLKVNQFDKGHSLGAFLIFARHKKR